MTATPYAKNRFQQRTDTAVHLNFCRSTIRTYQLKLSSSVERPLYAPVLPEFHHRWNILHKDGLLQLDVVIVTKHEVGSLNAGRIFERHREFVARIDQDLHSFNYIPVNDQLKRFQFLRLERLPVYYAHLFEKGTLAAFTRSQQQDLLRPSHHILILRQLSVDQLTTNKSILIVLRKTTAERCRQVRHFVGGGGCRQKQIDNAEQGVR